MDNPTTRNVRKTDIDAEMLAVKRIRRELGELPTTRSRIRALNYVLDALNEELGTAGQTLPSPPPDDRQPPLSFRNGEVVHPEEDLFPNG